MEKKKHILFISSWYPNRNDPTFAIFNQYFAEAVSLHNQVSVINVTSEENLKQEFEVVESNENNIYNITIYYKKVLSTFPIISQLRKRKKVLQAFEMGYQRLIKKLGKPDLIHLNVVMPMGIGAHFLAKKYDLPYVINENWSGYTKEDGNYKGLLQQFFTKRIVKGAEALLPTSDYLKRAMLDHGLNGNYHVIPNVANVHLFKPASDKINQPLKFIHISSLNDREKNVSGLIRAFGKALETNPDLELSIVGEGVDKPKYEQLIHDLELSAKIKFRGRLLKEKLVSEINVSDALIMFSNYETFCLVIIEAFACGKPVITSNAGAIADYMSPKLGIMVHKRNEAELTEAINNFVNSVNTFDKKYIRDYAVENYSYEVVGRKLDDIYNSVLANKNKPQS